MRVSDGKPLKRGAMGPARGDVLTQYIGACAIAQIEVRDAAPKVNVTSCVISSSADRAIDASASSSACDLPTHSGHPLAHRAQGHSTSQERSKPKENERKS